MRILVFGAAIALMAQGHLPIGRGDPQDGRLLCRGERVTQVVQAGETWDDGTDGRDVVLVLGTGAEVWTNNGDDLVCVYGDRGREYGHGSKIVTGPGNDTVITFGGSNYILTAGDDDVVLLNGHWETVEAGDGDDNVWALGATSADLFGEAGNDLIVGSPGGDVLSGGDGNDVMLGAGGGDTIMGDAANDQLFGDAGSDQLDGGFGADTCTDVQATTIFVSCETIPLNPGFPEAGGGSD
jgi:Ca2+-binding RTX toxin-like protein